MSTNSQKINTFLHYGYLPDPSIGLPHSLKKWLNGELPRLDFTSLTKQELTSIGKKKLKQAFQDEIGEDLDKNHVVPLSGGLDSRVVLAGLLEHVDKKNITAVTFGLPDSIDVKRAESITSKLRIKWDHINLSPDCWQWDTDLLIRAAKLSVKPTRLFDNAINYAIPMKYGMDSIFWSGFMGDSLGRLPERFFDIRSWHESKKVFASKNRRGKLYPLSIKHYDPLNDLPEKPYTSLNILDYYSQLHYCIRQLCFTRYIYSPVGFEIRYPFLNQHWFQFILSVPKSYRLRQSLYIDILKNEWPRLFSSLNTPPRDKTIIEKIKHGSVKDQSIKFLNKLGFSNRPRNNVNYIDFDYALREQKDLKMTVWSNLSDLKERKVIDWIDVGKLWDIHQSQDKNLADELLTLAALEIHIKADTLETDLIDKYEFQS